MKNMNIKAIIWDYDGTLVDTRHKNLNVTRNIIESLIEIPADEFSALKSLENYYTANRRASNWRELYRQEFDLTEEQVDVAGKLWTTYQLEDDTEVAVYNGIERVIGDLAGIPQGIVSQNSRSNIALNLAKCHLLPYFEYIVGYEEVDLKKQKPEPDGLLNCIEQLSAMESGCICYIGDHDTDIQCVRAANQVLQKKNVDLKIISIGACYDPEKDASAWNVRPDFEAHQVEDILKIIDHIKGSQSG
ncbi:MAG: HAD family hydrolase [bacterium]|nr:HAD family hydrolase [bacterium]